MPRVETKVVDLSAASIARITVRSNVGGNLERFFTLDIFQDECYDDDIYTPTKQITLQSGAVKELRRLLDEVVGGV